MDTNKENEECTLEQPSRLTEKNKQRLLKFGVVAFVGLIAIIFVRTTGTHELAEADPEAVHLGMEDNLLSDDVYEDFNAGLKQQDKVIKDQAEIQIDLQKRQGQLELEIEKLQDLLALTGGNLPAQNVDQINIPAGLSPDSFNSFPPPSSGFQPQLAGNDSVQMANSIQSAVPDAAPVIPHELQEEAWVGGISYEQGASVVQSRKKNKPEEFYMPPSFFGAKLLSGIDAKTNKEAKAHPESLMLMVDAPAVLPNYIKKNLKGCYVVANATGDLSSERVQLQVVSLSCLSPDGKAVIDERVVGYVSDKDGKNDLKGNVVARQGSNMSLLFVASAVGALGNQTALSTVTQTTSSGNNSITQTIEPKDALEHSLGGATKDTTTEYKNFLLDYIRQSSPVIEIGALKEATVFIKKGVWLKIRSTEDSSRDEENEKA